MEKSNLPSELREGLKPSSTVHGKIFKKITSKYVTIEMVTYLWSGKASF